MELSFGQRVDPSNGLVMPWFTHPALDEISAMNLSNHTILMFGSGLGDAWIARRCKKLYVVERNQEWLQRASGMAAANGANNIEYLFRPCNDSSGAQDMYCELPDENIDVIIVDDAYRYECIVKAIEHSKTRFQGIILIVDNWQQDYVFICPAAEELLKNEMQKIFVQENHTDHSGRPWATGIFYL